MTLAELRGRNGLTIVATVADFLKQLDRTAGTNHAAEYRDKATSGSYENLCAVTEEYALAWLPDTLEAHEGDLTGADDDTGYDEEEW